MATPLEDTPAFLEQIKKRPVIWDTSFKFYGDKHKLTAAWRQICKINWPDFDSRQADEKRAKCLDMQKKWKELRLSFTDYHRNRKEGGPKHKYEDQLAFFLPVITSDGATSSNPTTSQSKADDERPAKRRRSDVDPPRQSVTSSSCGDGEEDRQFLMSLVSFMQDVPRTSKLALRAEMMQLIMKYSQPQESTY